MFGSSFYRGAPDLPACIDINGKAPLAVDHIHDAIVDGRLRQLAGIVHQAGIPDRHQALDIGFVDLR
jgi:hypothetical protein